MSAEDVVALPRAAEDPGRHGAEIGPEEFKRIFRHHPGGVAVITLAGPHGPVGFTATSVISVSAAPAMLAFSLASTSSARTAVEAARGVAVNFLAADQEDLAARFARRGVDRFAGLDWLSLPTGEPVLPGVRAWVRGTVEQRVPVGDSLLVTLRAVRADDRAAAPLVYENRTYHRLGGHTLT
ncbi:flavin reductase family protein [Georgenia muralis]|uniref:Flavin reductase (DIM6/NTAB) family NADH-FMN oxidoreductase RutF n=1 Tax=Georgenia muralis TaxID=154117 RepID=A0A3N5A145_9MICO|nr:flavin reductase family protein [Georgenia muralis]RPF25601.1 flavin reductase (DIM6/NTAB) family NADH-FMN oxidoreductase RutF [Georgenia muralis]